VDTDNPDVPGTTAEGEELEPHDRDQRPVNGRDTALSADDLAGRQAEARHRQQPSPGPGGISHDDVSIRGAEQHPQYACQRNCEQAAQESS
jgi:hypothetical protein